jgi:Fur family peroxide stress response transcriptional regulator
MAASSGWKTSIKLGDGHRMTPQRREVYEVLMEHPDHPTATEVFMRVKERLPTISLATVYNCLDTLSGAGFIIQVNVDREPSRYCGNLSPHGHFHCEKCGTVLDVQLREGAAASKAVKLPRGAVVERFEIAVRGHCPQCVRKQKLELANSA